MRVSASFNKMLSCTIVLVSSRELAAPLSNSKVCWCALFKVLKNYVLPSCLERLGSHSLTPPDQARSQHATQKKFLAFVSELTQFLTIQEVPGVQTDIVFHHV